VKTKYGDCMNFATTGCNKELQLISLLLEDAYPIKRAAYIQKADSICAQCKDYEPEYPVS
jgi:hypothetical protein